MRFGQRLIVSLLSLATSDDLGIPNCESRSTSDERRSQSPPSERHAASGGESRVEDIDESGGIRIFNKILLYHELVIHTQLMVPLPHFINSGNSVHKTILS